MAFVNTVDAQSPQVKKQSTTLYQDVEVARKNGQMLSCAVISVIKERLEELRTVWFQTVKQAKAT